MLIYIKGHSATNPLMEIVHAMSGEKVKITENPDGADVCSILEQTNQGNKITTTILKGNERISHTMIHKQLNGRNKRQSIVDGAKICYYILASKVYNKTLPWGCITGIRPAKMAAPYLGENGTKQFMDDFFVSEEKSKLAIRVAKNQKQIMECINIDNFGVYIGIPFCPTRCLYCSFVSLSMDKQKKFINPYVECLCKEIEYTGKILKELGKSVGTIYIGGGTPTSLNENQLELIMEAVSKHLKGNFLSEFTVEAGRADTINAEKLKVLKDHDVSRISINPQTMNDNILNGIGRKHTTRQFVEAFELARKMGFDNINTDIIAGLPGEDYTSFMDSLNRLLELNPEAVTLHTMCIKRASALKNCNQKSEIFSASKMVSNANKILEGAGYLPYYMYRQKDTLDNLENTGYAKNAYECLYNIFMMEDMGSVIGIGAGSVTKLINRKNNQIERIFNLKDANEYVKNFDEILNRKNILKNKLEQIK